jgi:hypothetical protein
VHMWAVIPLCLVMLVGLDSVNENLLLQDKWSVYHWTQVRGNASVSMVISLLLPRGELS